VRLSLDLLTRAVAKTKRQRPGRGPMDLNRGPMDLDALVQSVRTEAQAQADRQTVGRFQRIDRYAAARRHGVRSPEQKEKDRIREAEGWVRRQEDDAWLALQAPRVRAACQKNRKAGWPLPTPWARENIRHEEFDRDLEADLTEIADREASRRVKIAGLREGKMRDAARVRERLVQERLDMENFLEEGVAMVYGEEGLLQAYGWLKAQGAWPFSEEEEL